MAVERGGQELFGEGMSFLSLVDAVSLLEITGKRGWHLHSGE